MDVPRAFLDTVMADVGYLSVSRSAPGLRICMLVSREHVGDHDEG